MTQRPTFLKHLYFIGVFIVLTLIAEAIGKSLLQYQSNLFTSDQWWRFITAHWVHTNWMHWLLNIGGLIFIVFLFPKVKWWQWFICGVVCSVLIALGLLLFNPDVYWYVGLSGVLHGYLSFGIVNQWHVHSSSSLLLLVVLGAKLLIEHINGPSESLESFIESNVVYSAHLYGAVGGACYGFLMLCFSKWCLIAEKKKW
ncbi:rhombosortase [Marinibactrum halimedae]|uniref:rhombosortase n=1 Tax=Marinibactrum halimedae TaxID=1444977 RepID=UPI001E403427|nr:rhombosortase [Marinibactrum halimedae]MCD9461275.1 rhombosortase [Marinibactrum halimedae]